MLDALAALLKAVSYAALLTCAGGIFAQRILPAAWQFDTYIATLRRRSAILLLLTTLGGATVLQQRLGGQFDDTTLSAIFSSASGTALFMHVAAVILVLGLGDDPAARGTRLASASLLTISFALSGHAATVGPFQGLIAMLHATAAAWWIGSLFFLRHFCRQGTEVAIIDLLRSFSALATKVVGALVASGVLLIAILTDFAELPALSDYERNLVVKILLVAVVLALATYNRWRLTPRILASDPVAIVQLRRVVDLELTVIALVLVATAILTTYTSPHM